MTSQPSNRVELAPNEWIWETSKDPSFHSKKYHAELMRYHKCLLENGKAGRIFVPLCGKTMDMIYLSEQGHEVIGLEFSEVGIKDFFAENNLTFSEEGIDGKPFVKYMAKERNITIYRGDLFDLSPDICGTFDAAWDRGSFVAINVPTRSRYAGLMSDLIKPSGKILMEITMYDGSKYSRPPHITTEHHLKENFKDFEVEVLKFEVINPPPSFYDGDDFKWGIALLTHL